MGAPRIGAVGVAVWNLGSCWLRSVSSVIMVAEYDPAWPQRFEPLRGECAGAMAAADVPVVAIEHVGSTSVPGLAAELVIDCDIVVAGRTWPRRRVLTGLGFTSLGELGVPAEVGV